MRERKMENNPDAAATQDANQIGVKKKRVYGRANLPRRKERGWSHAGARCSVLGGLRGSCRWVDLAVGQRT